MLLPSVDRSPTGNPAHALSALAKMTMAAALCLTPTLLSAGVKRASPDITAALIQACQLENWEATVWTTDDGIIADRSPTMTSAKGQCVDQFLEQANRKKL